MLLCIPVGVSGVVICMYFVFGRGPSRCSKNIVSCLATAPIFVTCEKSCIPSYCSSLRGTGVFTKHNGAKSEVLTAVLMKIYVPECDTVSVDKYSLSTL